MPHQNAVSKNTGPGQVTLGHLLLAIAFSQPVGLAVIRVAHSGGGALRYLIVVPVALGLGFLIAALDWKLGKAVWLRCRRYSNRTQNRVAIALFCLQLIWIVLGTALGFVLATFVVVHVQR